LQSADQSVARERRDAVLRAGLHVRAGDVGGRGAEQSHRISVLDVRGKVVGGGVGPSGQGQPLAVDEQLDGGSVGLATESSSLEDAVVRDAEGGEVELQDVVPCGWVEPRVHGRRGGDGRERGGGHEFAASDSGCFARDAAPHDGGVGGAGLGGAEGERGVERMEAVVNPDDDASIREALG
jgi:hypothetical protein